MPAPGWILDPACPIEWAFRAALAPPRMATAGRAGTRARRLNTPTFGEAGMSAVHDTPGASREMKAGDHAGMWLLLWPARKGKNGGFLCRCECGKEGFVSTWSLRHRKSLGCGCVRTKHGYSPSGRRKPEYVTWKAMIQRCHNPRHTQFANYGGRGLIVCDRWRSDFKSFLADMGPRPSPKHEIDRIDNNKGYDAVNCRWATRSQNNRNRRNNRLLTHEGETLTETEWAERLGCSIQALHRRLKHWSLEEALTRPISKKRQGG